MYSLAQPEIKIYPVEFIWLYFSNLCPDYGSVIQGSTGDNEVAQGNLKSQEAKDYIKRTFFLKKSKCTTPNSYQN